MRTPLAILNLVHGKWRTLVSTSGVSLAIMLIFMQLGFLGAVAGTAVQIYDHLQFDVLLRSPDYFHFCDARDISRSFLYQVASMPEVASVKPFHVTLATWRIPETPHTLQQHTAGELRGIVAMGMDPSANVFDLEDIRQQLWKLTSPEYVLIDRKTKGDDYGARNGVSFGDQDIDREVEVWDKRCRIAGHFELGAGLAANGSVLMGSAAYARIYPGDTQNHVNFGLVQLKPGSDPEDFCERVLERLFDEPATADAAPLARPLSVLPRQKVRTLEMRRWLWNTPIGSIFLAGVLVALVVGSVVVYMVLSNDVANHLREYATLKAMGYTDGFLRGVVMQQAVVMALLGYIVSLGCAELLYRVVGRLANIPLEMTWWIRGCVLILSVGMCCVSGVATLRKLSKAQPADLF
ncbi:MAG: FtsX-like permease family protein [Pirellulaceae bacterium]